MSNGLLGTHWVRPNALPPIWFQDNKMAGTEACRYHKKQWGPASLPAFLKSLA